jgi:oligosaccharide repeat unit polymerase
LLIAVIYVFSTLGRAALLVLLVLLLGIKMIMAKIKIRDYAYGFLAFIAFYGALAVVLGKGGSLEATYSENLRDITIIFFQYAGGPLYAFDNFINSNFELSFGEHTGRFFYALFYKMGITDTPPVDLVLPFVYVPYPSNVYTVYFPYVKDFGVIVSFFIIALMGFVHSHIYYRAKTGSYIYVLFYSMFLYPLIMSFFVDQYLSLLAQWLFFAILVITTAHFMKSSAPEMKRNEDTVAGHNNR